MILYRLAVTLSRPVVRLLFRPRVHGLEHVPAGGGFVLCANHLSALDTWALAYALFPRELRSMGKVELFERPLLGRLVTSLGAFPARRGDGAEGAVATAARLARAGNVVAIFPEGARRRPDREHRPRTGAARTALAAGVPLVPAGIRGTDGWRRFRRWQIVFGSSIPLDDLHALGPIQAAREMTRRLWEAILALGAEPAGDRVAADAPAGLRRPVLSAMSAVADPPSWLR